MADITKDSVDSKSSKVGLLKYIGIVTTAIGIIVPLFGVLLQYRQSIQQDLDKSFREIVVKLTAPDRETRIAAAANMGTFVKKDGAYYNQVIDVLVNRSSTEIDYNVLHAIINSLEKADEADYKSIVSKLLKIERVNFIQENEIKRRVNVSHERLMAIGLDYFPRLSSLDTNFLRNDINKQINYYYDGHSGNGSNTNPGLKGDSFPISGLNKELDLRFDKYFRESDVYYDLKSQKQVISDFITIYLSKSKSVSLSGVEFFRNSLNSVNLLNLNFNEVEFKLCALSSSNIFNTSFDGAQISNTVFSYSVFNGSSFKGGFLEGSLFNETILENVDFTNAKFEETYFAGADLKGAKFLRTSGLKPIYFFYAQNTDKAEFDAEFLAQLNSELGKISIYDFTDFINNKSNLDKSRKTELLNSVNRVYYQINSSGLQ